MKPTASQSLFQLPSPRSKDGLNFRAADVRRHVPASGVNSYGPNAENDSTSQKKTEGDKMILLANHYPS
jgi:hypothetical protein